MNQLSYRAAARLAVGLQQEKSEEGQNMDYVTSETGLMVHSHPDWPCAGCRPQETSDRQGFCLCVKCAHAVLSAAGAGSESARLLLDDITDALVMLESCFSCLGGWVN